MTWDEYRASRDEVRKVKGQTEFTMARDTKDNKKGFSNYIGDIQRPGKNKGPLLKKNEWHGYMEHGKCWGGGWLSIY